MLIDREPPGRAYRVDADEQGNGGVTEQRLYQLVRQPKPIFGSGVEIFAFTFG
jgi:hypothetical protein